MSNVGGVLEQPRVAVAGARHEHDRASGGDLDPAERGAHPRHSELGAQRALQPQRLLNEVRDAVAVGTDLLLQVGPLAEHAQREREKPDRRLLPAGEEVGGQQGGVLHLGGRAVGERRRGEAGRARRCEAPAGGPRCTPENRS